MPNDVRGSSSASGEASSRREASASRPTRSSPASAAKRLLVFALVRAAQLANRALMTNEALFKLRFAPGFEAARWRLGEWRAWRVYELARREVPAYREIAASAPRAFASEFAALPEIDKHSYVKAFPLEAQCLDGAIPRTGVVVD